MVEECIRMLMEERIEPKLAGVDMTAVEADSAGAEEERSGAAPRWTEAKIV